MVRSVVHPTVHLQTLLLLGALSAVMASLLDHKAILTTEEQATLATIGANVEMRARDLQEILQEWMGADQL